MARKSRDAEFQNRCKAVVKFAEGKGSGRVARELQIAVSTALRAAHRFLDHGEAGLIDRREDNGERKITEDLFVVLFELISRVPTDYGWTRTTWSRELLAKEIEKQTGLSLSVTSVSRMLRAIGARWKRPKPTVLCPWSPQKRGARLARIRRLVNDLPPDEVVLYEDEVDIHLNPKIGPDWMPKGVQKRVVTPGQNKKGYLAGALHRHTGELLWVDGPKKNSALFLKLLQVLLERYPEAKTIHLIVDNYIIHSSRQTDCWLSAHQERIRLHFLPPYCPDHNRIEAEWRILHANVTRNHRCKTIEELMDNVRRHLTERSCSPEIKRSLERAA